jgi:hypothetical protein
MEYMVAKNEMLVSWRDGFRAFDTVETSLTAVGMRLVRNRQEWIG